MTLHASQSEVVKQENNQTGMVERVLQGFLAIIFPVLLLLVTVRLVMTPAFLQFEYNRAGFPEDFYGLTREERLQYAPYAIEYLMNGEDIDFLANLRFPDGTELFNARELRHMRDVKVVTQAAFATAIALGLLAVGAAALLWRRSRVHLRHALLQGSVFTLAIIASIIIVAVFNWEFFFTAFHSLFFENDTWYFAYSDTLIRLFPEQFWFDAALLIGSLTTLIALMVLFVMWQWGRRTLRSR
jgi:integral membrane protein (TIGR01906 family)